MMKSLTFKEHKEFHFASGRIWFHVYILRFPFYKCTTCRGRNQALYTTCSVQKERFTMQSFINANETLDEIVHYVGCLGRALDRSGSFFLLIVAVDATKYPWMCALLTPRIKTTAALFFFQLTFFLSFFSSRCNKTRLLLCEDMIRSLSLSLLLLLLLVADVAQSWMLFILVKPLRSSFHTDTERRTAHARTRRSGRSRNAGSSLI